MADTWGAPPAKFIPDLDELRARLDEHRGRGETIVFTNGAFDLLHVGHIRCLVAARAEGDVLVVAVNSDDSIKAYKDAALPVNPEMERVEVLAAFEAVDYITLFSDPRAHGILTALKPDVHAKGTDYSSDNLPERDAVLAYGGRIAIVGDPKDHSTTDLIARVSEVASKRGAGPLGEAPS